MKDIIDVMAFQQIDNTTNNRTVPINYKRNVGYPMLASRFIFECSIKLNMKPLTSAMAAIIFHRFKIEVKYSDYDDFLIASASIYLAGKIKDDPIKIRDVINIAHNTLNRGASPLELGDEYWTMRDAIVQAELLIARMLKFDISCDHPHKYMLHYMKTLQEWFGTNVWNSMPIAKTSAAFLQDFHHSPAILNYKPSHVAVCCLSFAFQIYGVHVPLTEENDEGAIWYSVFCRDLTKEEHWEIIEKIMEVYKNEYALDAKCNPELF